MRRLAVVVLASLVLPGLLPAQAALPASTQAKDPRYTVFAAGGTPLSNGVFFPGTAECDRRKCTPIVAPLEIPRGTNITFNNLDVFEVANAHSVVSVKTNKKGRPLFASRDIRGPQEARVRTKHLKPGKYPFFCRTHYGMYGVLKVVKP